MKAIIENYDLVKKITSEQEAQSINEIKKEFIDKHKQLKDVFYQSAKQFIIDTYSFEEEDFSITATHLNVAYKGFKISFNLMSYIFTVKNKTFYDLENTLSYIDSEKEKIERTKIIRENYKNSISTIKNHFKKNDVNINISIRGQEATKSYHFRIDNKSIVITGKINFLTPIMFDFIGLNIYVGNEEDYQRVGEILFLIKKIKE